jgi:hypothetical protein
LAIGSPSYSNSANGVPWGRFAAGVTDRPDSADQAAPPRLRWIGSRPDEGEPFGQLAPPVPVRACFAELAAQQLPDLREPGDLGFKLRELGRFGLTVVHRQNTAIGCQAVWVGARQLGNLDLERGIEAPARRNLRLEWRG